MIVVARRREKLGELKKQITEEFAVDVVIMTCDLGKYEEIYNFYKVCRRYDIDVWINNAGMGIQKKICEQSVDEIQETIRINIEATTILSALYVQDNMDKDYCLINISSVAGYRIAKRLPIYSASKMYICAITESLYYEMQEGNKPLRIKSFAAANTAIDFELRAVGKALDLSKFNGNTAEEVAEFIYRTYQSNYPVAYVDNDFKLCFSKPCIPHSSNKKEIRSLLEK